jgi:chromosome segregation ATPase
MGDYQGQIAKQDFETQVADSRTHLTTAPQASRDALENFDAGAAERLEVLLDHVLVLTSTLTPEVVPTEKPGQLKAVLNEVGAALAYLDDPANAHAYVSQIVGATNNLAAQLWSWQGSASGADWKDSVTGAAATYRRSLGQQLSSFNSELEGLSQKVLAARQELDAIRETAQQFESDTGEELTALKERNAEHLSALDAQIQTINNQVTAALSRQDASIQQYQEQFSTA